MSAVLPQSPTPLSPKEYGSDQDVRWCPGCGDYSILAQMKKAMSNVQLDPAKTVFISGIGCSSRFPYYMDTYGMHGIHGRAPAVACGLKIMRPDLTVFVITGDGDGLSIGGNHFLHTIRRNIDINIILFNNRIYGLTKGQASPTSEFGKRTKSTPIGSIDFPVHPCTVAIGAEATFVARSVDVNVKHLATTLESAIRHKGTSFIEIYQNCNIFNDGAFSYATDRKQKFENVLELEEGKPMRFGKNGEKGIRMRNFDLEVVDVDGENGVPEDELLVHNAQAKEPTLAYLLSRMSYPNYPEPIGILRNVEQKTYDSLIHEQLDHASNGKKDYDLDELFKSGETWTVD